MAPFLDLIPRKLDPDLKESPRDFTRERKLPLAKLIAFILSLSAGGKRGGVDTQAGTFFTAARRSGLWPEAGAVHRSSLTRARRKVPWTVFRDILSKAVELAYSLWPRDPAFLWHGMSVIAVDGSKYTLPATDEIRKAFHPRSGLQFKGKGHFPQCLVTTAVDVFRRLPIARSVVPADSSERDEVRAILPSIPAGCVLLFDRGYPSFELISHLRDHYQGYFLFRCPARSTFPAVEAFVRSGKRADYILLTASNNYLQGLSPRQRKKAKVIQLRAIRLVSPDGKVSVLLTNLLSQVRFGTDEIVSLYFRRWAAEDQYRNEKISLEVEVFHGKTCNSIRQELFAVLIMCVIARTLSVISSRVIGPKKAEFQFKNAVLSLAADAAVLVPQDPEQAVVIFTEILQAIARVKYYRRKSPRASQPRVTRRAPSKWCSGKTKELHKA